MEVVAEEINSRSGTITIQDSDMNALTTHNAKEFVLARAQQRGLSKPGISSPGSPYPVDEHGNSSGDVLAGRVPVAHYRCDYGVNAGL